MTDNSAYQAFEQSAAAIRSLVRCADITSIHTLALLRGEEPNTETIRHLIEHDKVSTLAHSWQWYMAADERQEFGQRSHLRALHEHIVFASYVAIESYLIQKFYEYFRHLYNAPDDDKLYELEHSLSLRSLKEINRNYRKFIGISITCFDHPSVSTYEEAPWFHPGSCWEGLCKLEKHRNQLAHTGSMDDAELIVLVDAWSAYCFCNTYASMFEVNFNSHIYDGKPLEFGGKEILNTGYKHIYRSKDFVT